MPVSIAKAVVEFIGTFFLVFTVGMTVKHPDAATLAPLAIGSALMIMIYAGGHSQGGHYNPAVTLGVTLRGKCTWADAIPYWVAQFAAAVAAALCVLFIKGTATRAPPAPTNPISYGPAASFLASSCSRSPWSMLSSTRRPPRERRGTRSMAWPSAFSRSWSAHLPHRSRLRRSVQSGRGPRRLCHAALPDVKHLVVYLIADFPGGAAAAFLFNYLDMGGDKATV